MSRTGLRILLTFLTLVIFAGAALAQNTGHIFTTFSDGTTVNGNIFPSKAAVYLNGGPQNHNSKGLPDGIYYFQVTDPNGTVLLSTDGVSCRQLQVTGGIVVGATGSCPHANGAQNTNNGGSIPVQLIPFNDTPNSGGEYKVWITPKADYDSFVSNHTPGPSNNFGFISSNAKTDNFKVQSAAHVKVCKFNDQNGNGLQDNTEPLIPHWPVNATGVAGDSGNGVLAQTDDNGCVTFAITNFPNGSQTVTLTEGSISGWQQTAPLGGSCTGVPSANNCSVLNGTITLSVSPNDSINAPDFGNVCIGTSCGSGLTVSKVADPSFTRTYKWTISKSVDQSQINTAGSAAFNYTVNVNHDDGTDSDWKVTGAITVSNPTPVSISGITVTDAVDNGGTCTVDTSNFNGTIAAGAHVDLPYTCTYSSLPAAGTNTATVTWDDSTKTGTAAVDFAQASINVTDGNVTVTDTFGGTLGTATYTDTNPKSFTYSHTFSGDPAGTCTVHNNTATFTTDSTSATGSDSKSVKVCVGANLLVTKTAAASFNSSISKTANKTLVEQAGGTITFNYTVSVTESGWNVAGIITVTNPNDWEAITANLSDLLSDSGGVCTIAGGGVVTVPASSSQGVAYTCAFSSVPAAGSGTNTATASWDGAAAFTSGSSASGSAAYAFGTLTVTDSVQGALGTVTVPPGSATFTYSRTVNNAVGGQCQSFPNTATIVETNQLASKTVTVCNTATGALTMGFWQNKNGQGIITGGASTGSVCNSGTFLRNFTPFQDLSSTATCSQVGTYVTGIIKAANASGAAMNAMLKGQMLSTALDVFFSDPTLGGNKINAPTPIGTVKIDLTQVCNMLDGSGGTGSCTGTFQNVSSAFGGATSMTVLNMLLFQNTVSNSGGSLWYGQVKSTQQMAKNAFDAINNQAALIAP